MRWQKQTPVVAVLALQPLLLLGCTTTDVATREESPSVRQRADAVFQTRLQTHGHATAQLGPVPRRRGMAGDPSAFSIEQSERHTWHQTNGPALITTGCGDLLLDEISLNVEFRLPSRLAKKLNRVTAWCDDRQNVSGNVYDTVVRND